MSSETIIKPGLTVTEEMFQRTRAELIGRIPDEMLPNWETFINPEFWTLEPTREGTIYSAARIMYVSDERIVTVLKWLDVETGVGIKPLPYNSPYHDSNEIIVTGGYTDRRYRKFEYGIDTDLLVLKAGDATHLSYPVYRKITSVEPDTMTVFIGTKPISGGKWSFFDPETGEIIEPEDNKTPNHTELYRKLNQL